MRWKTVLGLGALVVAAVSLSAGCLIVGPREKKAKCGDYSYEKCTTYCDPHNCWEECSEEKVKPEECPEGGERSCGDDTDCSQGSVCISGTCRPRGGDEGTHGICQGCQTAYDCADSAARCVNLGSSGSGAICTSTCRGNSDCPNGFDCVKSGGESRGHCLPAKGADGTRSCDDVPDLECTSDEDCNGVERCVENTCKPPRDADCSDDADCPSGELCRDLKCVPSDETECVSRSDCRSDEVCVNGTCKSRSPSDGCVFNRECDEDSLCVDGRCLSTCTDKSDCNSSEYCRCLSENNGSCQEGICEPIECRRNEDCPTGKICVEARCRDACQKDSDCGDGYVCSPNGFCKDDPNVECRSNAECARDEMCNDDGECVKPCSCNQQCPSGEVCDMSTGLCEQPGGSKEPECEDDCDCPSGESCSNGTCG